MFKRNLGSWGAIGLSFLVLLCTPVAKAAYTYAVTEVLPCVGCNGASSIGLNGTITVNTLGNLTPANFTDWNLGIVLEGQNPIYDTPASSLLTFEGNPGVVANNNTLVFQLFTAGDAIVFSGTPSAQAGWRYGSNPPAQYLFYQQYEAPSNLQLPATLELGRIGAAEVPEPTTLALFALSAVLALIVKRRHGAAQRSAL